MLATLDVKNVVIYVLVAEIKRESNTCSTCNQMSTTLLLYVQSVYGADITFYEQNVQRIR